MQRPTDRHYQSHAEQSRPTGNTRDLCTIWFVSYCSTPDATVTRLMSVNALPAAAAATPTVTLTPAVRVEIDQLIELIAKCKPPLATDGEYSRLLPFVKEFVRRSDSHAAIAVESLMAKMRDPVAQVRINLVNVVDCLFMRSKTFRSSLLGCFHSFLDLAALWGPSAPIPPRPPIAAAELQKYTIACVKTWDQTYGEAIKLLRLGAEHMRSRVGNIDAPSRYELESARERLRAHKAEKLQSLLRARYHRSLSEYDTYMPQLSQLIQQIDGGIELLCPQVNQHEFNEYIMRSDPTLAVSPSNESDAAAAASSHTASVPADASATAVVGASSDLIVPSAAPPDDIEWESDPPVEQNSSVSEPAHTSQVASQSSRPPTTHVPPLDSSIAPASVDHPAATAFTEHDSTDSLWWLDEQLDDEGQMIDDDGGEEDDLADAGEDTGGAGDQSMLAHGLNRNYRLHIEFDANFAATETEDNRAIFQTLRDAWSQIQRSLLPMLNDWIDTLTRVEFKDNEGSAASASSASSSSSGPISSAALDRSRRDRFLLECVAKRERLDLLLRKCTKLQLNVSTLTAERLAAVRRAAERNILSPNANDAANAEQHDATSGQRSTAPTPSSSAAAAMSHHRYAAHILAARARAERRATNRIRAVKRKHARLLESERLERRLKPEDATDAAAALRRPFSRQTYTTAHTTQVEQL